MASGLFGLPFGLFGPAFGLACHRDAFAQAGDYLPALAAALKNGREAKRPPKAPEA